MRYILLVLLFCSCASSKPTEPTPFFDKEKLEQYNNIDTVIVIDYGYYKEESVIYKHPETTDTNWWVASAFLILALLTQIL